MNAKRYEKLYRELNPGSDPKNNPPAAGQAAHMFRLYQNTEEGLHIMRGPVAGSESVIVCEHIKDAGTAETLIAALNTSALSEARIAALVGALETHPEKPDDWREANWDAVKAYADAIEQWKSKTRAALALAKRGAK